MAWQKITDLLAGKVPVDTEVTVKGWVRTRRDSKAGLSFLHLHDGTCLANLQVVAPKDLPNYEAEILRVGPGCRFEALAVGLTPMLSGK